MKRILIAGMTVAVALMALDAQAMSLAEAQEKLSVAAESPKTMAEVMKELSAEDQVQFLKAVNEAIEKMPVSPEKKAALYVDANKMAMSAAQPGNTLNLLAETFATASLEALTVINEVFAKEVFSRNADPTHPVTDERMTSIAQKAMAAIAQRAEKETYSTERKAFAALMLLRAAEQQPADLQEKLVAGMPEVVGKTWLPKALGTEEGRYEPMMGNLLVNPPDAATVYRLLAAPQPMLGSMIGDLGAVTDGEGTARAPFSSALLDPNQYALPDDAMDFGMSRVPRTMNKDEKWYNGYNRTQANGSGDSHHHEPVPYRGQRTH